MVMTSCPAQTSPPVIATNSATTEPARARSSAGETTTPAARRDRRKKYDSSSAPTRLTPSGVTATAVVASAPDSPNTVTSPDGVTDPPAPSATTAAVIGPSDPAASASSRRNPSAAVPAIPIRDQLTAATADTSTSTHGTRVPAPAAPVPVAVPMADPPIRGAAVEAAHVPLAWFTTLRADFNPARGRSVNALVRARDKARLSVRGPGLK